MTRKITLDPEQRHSMVAILGSILDNEHDKFNYPDILALVAPLVVVTEALSRALERLDLIGALDEAEEWQESGDSIVNYPLVHEYQLVHNALKALNNHNALIADLKEA